MNRTPRNDGYRFLVSPDGKKSRWIEPLDAASHADWHDCTDMTGGQVADFVDELLAAQNPVEA